VRIRPENSFLTTTEHNAMRHAGTRETATLQIQALQASNTKTRLLLLQAAPAAADGQPAKQGGG
jgi:hypothetical protein